MSTSSKRGRPKRCKIAFNIPNLDFHFFRVLRKQSWSHKPRDDFFFLIYLFYGCPTSRLWFLWMVDLRGRTKCLASSLSADTEGYSPVVLLMYMYILLQVFIFKLCKSYYNKDFILLKNARKLM